MAASTKSKFAHSLAARLSHLACPYTEGADESWIVQLVSTPGEPRIRILQWLFAKFDSKLGELVDNSQSIIGSKMDSRIQRLLFVASSLGLCRYDDVEIIRGCDCLSPSSVRKQEAFIDMLVDIVWINDTADDPVTKSMLMAGLISDSSSLEKQMTADCRYLDNLARNQLPTAMLRPTVDLLPHDLQRSLLKEKTGDSSLQTLIDQRASAETQLSRRLDALVEFQQAPEQSGNRLQHCSHTLDLVLGELSQLMLSFTYCFENEMMPWCNRPPPVLSQLGPAFKRVHHLCQQFTQMVQALHQIHKCCLKLEKGVKQKLKTTDQQYASVLAEISLVAASSLQDCVDILDLSLQNEQSLASSAAASLSTTLTSSLLKL